MADRHEPTPLPLLLLVLLACAGDARAAGIERALMPGPVVAHHAEVEDDCDRCHVAFDRAAQPRLCAACHEQVAADLRAGTGYHGRLADRTCSACHTDHKGRDAVIVHLDRAAFDHARTDFALSGAHAQAACDDCHAAGKPFRAAPPDCNGCHAVDDAHRGSLGADCAECHDASAWKPASFDHGRTGFELRGAHEPLECKACHAQPPALHRVESECASCHADDDVHRGALGRDCGSCHVDRSWSEARFDHRSTGFALEGAHADADCADCHAVKGRYTGAPTACKDCHADDDRHRGTLGGDCGACHRSVRWDAAPRFDHARTRFALDGAHRAAHCGACHADATRYRGAPLACIQCHREDDSHEGRNGSDCADCHSSRDWKQSLFDHDRDTGYALRGAHRAARCEACHAGSGPIGALPTDCNACHEDEDPHQRQLGERCEQCHQERDWKATTFDHDRGSFPLLGAHRLATCDDCHRSAAYLDAEPSCRSCHADRDVHEGAYGKECDGCHVPRDWLLWEFDHRARTPFALEGAHASTACKSCHAPGRPVPEAACGSCHAGDDVHEGSFGRRCEQCHGVDSFRGLRPDGVRRH